MPDVVGKGEPNFKSVAQDADIARDLEEASALNGAIARHKRAVRINMCSRFEHIVFHSLHVH